ncbi:TetR family transcriptional regulator [Thermoactinospora rubra]|uniref:TetR/AcrR family transcriptional regulator n=1 Tax=Thermoactinospora rubra TaxID=1088767 RepID=UPI003B848943
MTTPHTRKRMTGRERREQLIRISRALFADKGFDATSIEEVAATAQVSKPVVYEHFGGKEGLYAVVVDREMQKLLGMITEALSAAHSLIKLERAALALLQYIEESSEGFRILVRDSHAASGTGTFASLISEIASQVEDVLADEFLARGYDPKLAPMYAQMLVGMVALTGQWWLDVRKPSREEVAAHLVNLAWNGLTGLNPQPTITAASRNPPSKPPPVVVKDLRELEKERREAEKARAKELREAEKARQRELKERQRQLREAEKAREREEKIRQREARLAERRAARLAEKAQHSEQAEESVEQ